MKQMAKSIISFKEDIYVNLFIVLLALLSVFLLVYEFSVVLSPEQIKLIHQIDLVIAFFFLFDFFIGFFAYKDRAKYFKENWLDLVASIPVSSGVYRSFRVLRILRLIRVIRILQIRKLSFVSKNFSLEGSRYLYLLSIFTSVILFGAVSFFTLEVNLNPQVNNFSDALWWTIGVSTVGSGEIYPVTSEGRLIGAFLMIFGVGLIGTIAGFVGSHYLKLNKK